MNWKEWYNSSHKAPVSWFHSYLGDVFVYNSHFQTLIYTFALWYILNYYLFHFDFYNPLFYIGFFVLFYCFKKIVNKIIKEIFH